MKTCHKCREAKAFDAFAKSSSTRDGLQAACRTCKRAYYLADKPAYQARHAVAYGTKRAEIRASSKEYYWKNAEERRAVSRARYERLPVEMKIETAQKASQRDRDFPGQAQARTALRRARLRKATPPWLGSEHQAAMRKVYEAAETLRSHFGAEVHVDHIVPIRGRTVCGLHVPWNLQLLPAKENILKNNRYWPDKP